MTNGDEYFAGLFDGEGCFASVKTRRAHEFTARIQMGHKKTVALMKDRFGGRLHMVKSTNPKHKDKFIWMVTGIDAVVVAEALIPFLVTKKRQAQLFVDVKPWLVRRGGKLSVQAVKERNRIGLELRKLNKTGPIEIDRKLAQI